MSILDDPNNWTEGSGGVRRLKVGHLIHEFKTGQCAKCKNNSKKLEFDPWLGYICPRCSSASIEARSPKPYSAWIYKMNGKEVKIKQVFAASRASLNIELGNYVYSQTRVKQDVVWEVDGSYYSYGYYTLKGVLYYLKEK